MEKPRGEGYTWSHLTRWARRAALALAPTFTTIPWLNQGRQFTNRKPQKQMGKILVSRQAPRHYNRSRDRQDTGHYGGGEKLDPGDTSPESSEGGENGDQTLKYLTEFGYTEHLNENLYPTRNNVF